MSVFNRTRRPAPPSIWPLDFDEMAQGLRALADGLDAGDDEAIALVDNADLHPATIAAYLNRRSA
ncbi:hypothetical protein AB0953_16605 [Streptomyces sp. NPDC046866]|uniref:hypothetical protein n=1 Tax=Streptomyces sp. NPDC046866 TaxID=3154921 RepID=UPI003451B743